MPNLQTNLLVLTVILVLLPEIYAFGAGDIPDFAYLNNKAYRHGDIENCLESLVKWTGKAAAGGGLLGFAKTVLQSASGGPKFTSRDIKKVYYGNWLRDYSQAVDIAGLTKLSGDTLVLVVSILGFMTFGFATDEFEVTAERLGVYLPTEHIDNPRGYAEKEGDARSYHPKLRGPVDPRELETDSKTGIKNYIANEGQGWDTTTALLRRIFKECIEKGRNSNGQDGPELYEAYRLLGTGLHTIEDLLAHSNFIELALVKLGHTNVFCHVGDNVRVETPNGSAAPLTTGTFGGADFLHSLVSGATDKLSQASVTDLSQKLEQASQEDTSNVDNLKSILKSLPTGGSDDKINASEDLHAKSKAYHFDPDNIAPPEAQEQMKALLRWHDDVMRDILSKIELVPGLDELVENLSNAINAYVYTVLAPYVMPILQQAISVLDVGSQGVMEAHAEEQYEVFDDPNASDPSHSLLSKDHFDNILNEPAGKIAIRLVEYTVNLIVPAWSDNSNPDEVINRILECFHHPFFATGQSQIQNEMMEYVQKWLGGLGPDDAQKTIQLLSKDNVRNAKNKRLGSENQDVVEPGYGGRTSSTSQRPSGQQSGGGRQQQQQTQGQAQTQSFHSDNQKPYGRAEQEFGGRTQQSQYGGRQQQETQYGQAQTQSYQSSNRDEQERGGRTQYGQGNEASYGGAQQQSQYGQTKSHERSNESSYGRTETQYGGNAYGRSEDDNRHETSGYGGTETSHGRTDDSYGRSQPQSNFGRTTQESFVAGSHQKVGGYGQDEEDSRRGQYDGHQQQARGAHEREDHSSGYGGRQTEQRSSGYGGGEGYGQRTEELRGNQYEAQNFGSRKGRKSEDEDSDDDKPKYGRKQKHDDEKSYAPSYGQASSGYGQSSGNYGGGSPKHKQGGRRDSDNESEDSPHQSSKYSGRNETFGAERLHVNSGSDDEDRKSHGRHGGRRDDY